MSEEKRDFEHLSLDYVELDKENKIYIVPVVVPFLREGKNRATTIKNFNQTLQNANIPKSFDLKLNKEDNHEPFVDFDDTEYYITELNSLNRIKENKRFNCNFGFRYYIPHIDNERLIPISNKILGELTTTVSDINQEIEFSNLQPLSDEIAEALKLTIKHRPIEALEELVGKQLKVQDYKKDVDTDKEIKEEHVEKEEENLISDTSNTLENVEEFSEESHVDLLKKDLYATIDAMIPQIYIDQDELDFNNTLNTDDYDEKTKPTYKKLEQITLNDYNQAKEDRLKLSRAKRKTIVKSIYDELVSEIWSRSIETEKLLNYKSQESEYHQSFKEIDDKYEETKNNIPDLVEKRIEKLTAEFERDKRVRAEKAKREMEEKIEYEERPILEKRVNEYEIELKEVAKDVYNDQIDILNTNVSDTYQLKISKIVDDVISDYSELIKSKANTVKEMVEKDYEKLLEKRERDNELLREKIRKIEEERIRDSKDFEDRVSLEVEKNIQDYVLKDTQMNDEISYLRTEMQKIKNENIEKEQKIKSLSLENQNDKKLIQNLNNTLDKTHNRNYDLTQQSMDIQQKALEFKKSNLNFSNVAALNHNDVGNLPKEVAEKVTFIENVSKKGFIGWLSALVGSVLVGTMLVFGVHSTKAQQEQQQNIEAINKQKESDHQKEIDSLKQRAEKDRDSKIEAERKLNEEKEKMKEIEKQAKEKKVQEDKKKKEDKKKD